MAKVTVTKDSRKKCDVIIGKAGNLTFSKDVVVRIDDDDDNPCKATKIILMKLKAGADGYKED